MLCSMYFEDMDYILKINLCIFNRGILEEINFDDVIK